MWGQGVLNDGGFIQTQLGASKKITHSFSHPTQMSVTELLRRVDIIMEETRPDSESGENQPKLKKSDKQGQFSRKRKQLAADVQDIKKVL